MGEGAIDAGIETSEVLKTSEVWGVNDGKSLSEQMH
jgi:hypothetical protein